MKLKKILKIRDVAIGEGTPKICVPIIGQTLAQIIKEARHLKTIQFDIVEWRADFFEDIEDIEKVMIALEKVRDILYPAPLIFTFRSAEEGGDKEISKESYVALNKAVIASGFADIIDIEFLHYEEIVDELIEFAHANQVRVILSNHDFHQTPSKEEILARLIKAQELGGDLPKIAVMPRSARDVLTLIDATLTMNEQYADRPIITMSMANLGMISRLAGEVFGSSITFGAAQKASAPGQIETDQLRNVLNILTLPS